MTEYSVEVYDAKDEEDAKKKILSRIDPLAEIVSVKTRMLGGKLAYMVSFKSKKHLD